MPKDAHISRILADIRELHELLNVIDAQGADVPGVLYRLAKEKSKTISLRIESLRSADFWNARETALPVDPEEHPAVEDEPLSEVLPDDDCEQAPVACDAPEFCDEEADRFEEDEACEAPEAEEPFAGSEPEAVFAIDEEPVQPEEVLAEEISVSFDEVQPDSEPGDEPEKDLLVDVPVASSEEFAEEAVESESTDDAFLEEECEEEPECAFVIEPENDEPENAQPETAKITLEEAMQRRIAKELRRAISLNDRFRFRRELFRNNDVLMNETLALLDAMKSYDEAEDYIFNDLKWDRENPEVKDFMSIVENHFLS